MDDEMRQLIQQAAVALKAAGAQEVYLFGSAARGTLRPDSDIDLAVSGLPPALFFRAMAQAGDILGRPLDMIDLDDVAPFVRYLKTEGGLQCVL